MGKENYCSNSVRSGIRTHAYKSRLRPERSALDHTANPDDKDLKTKLIQEIGNNPDPDEAGLERFLKVICDHEAVINAR